MKSTSPAMSDCKARGMARNENELRFEVLFAKIAAFNGGKDRRETGAAMGDADCHFLHASLRSFAGS